MRRDSETEPLLGEEWRRLEATKPQPANGDDEITPFSDVTWRSETVLICRHAVPLIGTYLLQYFFSITVVVVCAHLSTKELAAVSLGLTTSNIVGLAIWEGMATALDTLCAQAYGANDLHLVGLHVLRFTVFVHVVAIPIAALWLGSPWIMPFLTPSAALATNASTFLQWYAIGIPGYASFEAAKRFLQAQGNFTTGLIVLTLCVPINIFLNWLLVFHFQLRIPGAALAAALTNLIRPFLLVGHVLVLDRQALKCWPKDLSWTRLCTNWKPMVDLALPGVMMTLSEWMAFEMLTFATSYAGTEELAAQTFLATISVIVWHIHFSGSVVTSTRLGQLIGGEQLQTAGKVASYYVPMFAAMAILDLVVFIALIEFVLNYFNDDHVVTAALRGALPFAIIFTFFDCMATCMHGIVRGLGWHSVGGLVTVACNYLFAVPMALVLELGPPKLGIRGLWMSLAAGLALISVIEGLVLKLRNWDCVVEEARNRRLA